jgi:secreted PhoX family phosphatase
VSEGWHAPRTRRGFLGLGALAVGSLLAAPALAAAERAGRGHGRPVPDPGGVVDLPPGFQYRILSPENARLTSGQGVPGDHDGMAAFAGPGGTTILVRNHELSGHEGCSVEGANPYDPGQPGGTTAIWVGPDRRELRSFVTSSGTRDNCSGGATPWGTWLTCEEDRAGGHGLVFEVDPAAPEDARSRTPVRGMGVFSHEAVGIDPRTSIAYLTEDDSDRGSFLYRYVPDDRRGRPGSLGAGGALGALALDAPLAGLAAGRAAAVRWIPVRPETAHDDAVARGATRFARLEGAAFGAGVLWFDDTSGGPARRGRLYRLIPGPDGDALELVVESGDGAMPAGPDAVVLTPFGDLWLAEDDGRAGRLVGVTPEGEVYEFARNRITGSELCGPCFAPDGRTAFVNIQNPGLTLAIWGPFPAPSAARRRQMARAAPPARACTPA